MFRRKHRDRAASEATSVYLSGLDAELEYVRLYRLPPNEFLAIAFFLAREAGDDSQQLMRCFAAGYEYGRDAQLFLTSLDESISAAIARAASDYSARKQLAAKLSLGEDAMGDVTLGAALSPYFLEVLPLLGPGMMIANADSARFASADEAFEDWSAKQVATDGGIPATARGYFHSGASFYAFETQLLLAVRQLELGPISPW